MRQRADWQQIVSIHQTLDSGVIYLPCNDDIEDTIYTLSKRQTPLLPVRQCRNDGFYDTFISQKVSIK